MVSLFIETVPQNVNDLKKALQEENWDQVGKTAHKLKSTVDSMGIKSIRQEIRTVEANAKQKLSLEEIPALVATIRYRHWRMYRAIAGGNRPLISHPRGQFSHTGSGRLGASSLHTDNQHPTGWFFLASFFDLNGCTTS